MLSCKWSEIMISTEALTGWAVVEKGGTSVYGVFRSRNEARAYKEEGQIIRKALITIL